jgi:histidinol-phosphate/aromatic aminotransferase/cobyric acid decarboxylase-like protein
LIPRNLGTIPMWTALAVLDVEDRMRNKMVFNNCQVKHIEESLGNITELTIFHSYGNYILFDGQKAGKTGNDMIEFTRKKV